MRTSPEPSTVAVRLPTGGVRPVSGSRVLTLLPGRLLAGCGVAGAVPGADDVHPAAVSSTPADAAQTARRITPDPVRRGGGGFPPARATAARRPGPAPPAPPAPGRRRGPPRA